MTIATHCDKNLTKMNGIRILYGDAVKVNAAVEMNMQLEKHYTNVWHTLVQMDGSMRWT